MIRQGEVYWIDLKPASGSGYRHPHVVVQNNLFNASRIRTVVVCAITSNMQRGRSPGNVVLKKGEANLPKPGVVNVTQIFTIDKSDLAERIGALSDKRVSEILAGMELVIVPRNL